MKVVALSSVVWLSRTPPLTLFLLIFHLSNFVFLTCALASALKRILLPLSHPLVSSLFLSGPASLKMKHRLPSSGTSTIFMLSQTTSTHSFSWSDWGLFFFLSALRLKSPAAKFLCLSVLLVSYLLCPSSPTVWLLPHPLKWLGGGVLRLFTVPTWLGRLGQTV